MAQTLSFSPLSLDLPNSRMSIDFSSFISSQPKPNSRPLRTDKPHPLLPQHQTVPRRAISRPLPLPNVKEEPDVPPSVPSRQSSRKWVWGRSLPRQSEPVIEPLSRTSSSASTTSHTSVTSTAVSSVFSNAQTISTARTSQSSLKFTKTLDTYQEEPLNLTLLPLSLLEHIIEYTLCVPLNVSIGPQNSENRHMQYRYHRAGLDYIDIQLILKHPIFMVSHHLRDVALDVFHRKCDFVIDLHRIYHTKVSSTINENLRKHQKFWVNETPKMVRDTLRNLSKLHLRLPVPSCENGGHRGRDEHDWMDGSDGKGGGGWKIKSLKREQEDAAGVQKCLESVMKLVMTDPAEETESRGRNSGLSRTGSLRRSISRARSRSRSRDRRASSRAQSRQSTRDEGDGKRQPLKRLEVTLVKRNPYVMVLPETLAQIKVLRSTPVTGFTKYFFELESQKILWATKYRKRWKGFEPDGTRLLNDLQGITVAEKPIEPIRTPTEFKFVNVGKDKKLQLSEHLMPKTPIILEKHPAERDLLNVPAVPSSSKLPRKPLPWSRKKANKRRDSFALMMDDGMEELGTSGTETSGRVNAPTVDELRKIVEDIRNGLY